MIRLTQNRPRSHARSQKGHLSLLKIWDEKTIQKHIFKIATLLNHAVPFLDEEQKMMLAEYNLQASQTAITSFAYRQGLDYTEIGISLLTTKGWKECYSLMFNLHENGIIAAGELKEDEKINIFFDHLLKNAKNIYETTQSHCKLIHYRYNLGDFEGSIKLARTALKKFNFRFPQKGSKLLVIIQYLKTRLIYWWKTRKGKERPKLTDPKIRAILDIHEAVMATISFNDVLLWTYCLLKQYEIMLKHGIHERELQFSIGFFYLGRAVIKDMSLPRSIIDEIDINDFKKYSNFPGLCVAYCGGLRHFVPLLDFVKQTEDMFLYSLGMGNMVYSSYIYMWICTHQFSAGSPIPKCKTFIQDYEDLIKKIDVYAIRWASASMSGVYESLLTGNEYSVIIDKKRREVDSLFQWLEEKGMHDQYFHLAHLIVFLKLVEGKGNEAWEYCQKGAPLREKALATPFKEHFLLYEILAIGLCYDKKNTKEQKEMRKICEKNIKELKHLLSQQKENYEYKFCLAKGEHARILGNVGDAYTYYRKGILLAKENQFYQDAAIGSERCALLELSLNDLSTAKTYLKEAIKYYSRWGAKAKVSEMSQKYSELLFEENQRGQVMSLDTSASTAQLSEIIDTKAYITAAEGISQEIDLENLIKVLVNVVMKNAGAEQVILMTKKDKEWFLTAEKISGDKNVTFLDRLLKDSAGKVPLMVIGEVNRRGKEIVLKNAYKESEFNQDPYIVQNKIFSILCVPLVYQKKIVASLYLENALTKGAFTEDIVQNILLLSSHIANALENAFLYEELKEYSKDLEIKVQKRTKEITQKNEALTETLEELKKTQKQLVATEKLASLGELTSGIAHEIRNPLNSINNFSTINIDMAKENRELFEQLESEEVDQEKLREELLENLDTLGGNQRLVLSYGERVGQIVDLMEKHARIGTGMKLPTSLSCLIEGALASARSGIEGFPFSIDKHYDESIDQVSLVLDEIDFVLSNVIKNAQEAMWEKGEMDKEYQPHLIIQTEKTGDMVGITIKDNGIGIEEENLNKVFNPFYTSKPTGQAIGLALSISRMIVTSIHHGYMTISSEAGLFTEVTITLPQE